MILKAHAKINLLLNVMGIRLDGYHELETIMQTLELHDILEISEAPNIEIDITGADLPTGPENLAYKAAALLREYSGYTRGIKIKLYKHIPLAAGLAGGSSDAAAVLNGLNQYWNLKIKPKELASLGAKIGSDIPFCLQGGTALVRGRGEIVSPVKHHLPPLGVVLVKPLFGVSTAQIYRLFDQVTNPFHPDYRGMLKAIERNDLVGFIKYLGNSLEPVTISLHPEIIKIKKEISNAGAIGTLMSGSGPTVFGLFENLSSAEQAAEKINMDSYWVKATCFC